MLADSGVLGAKSILCSRAAVSAQAAPRRHKKRHTAPFFFAFGGCHDVGLHTPIMSEVAAPVLRFRLQPRVTLS